MAQCPKCGNKFTIKKRSNDQNSLYWGFCVEPFAEHLKNDGYTAKDVHELFKLECNFKVMMEHKNGVVIEKRIPKTTTGLTTVEFKEFIDRVIIYAAEQGCYLSMPGDPIE